MHLYYTTNNFKKKIGFKGNDDGNVEISNIFGSEIARNRCTFSLHLQPITNFLLLCGDSYDDVDVVNDIKIYQMSIEWKIQIPNPLHPYLSN